MYSKKTEQHFLNWKQRIQIALDIANGINYLHSYTSSPCIHRDLNASNVLLNSEFRAIISNFSIARLAEGQEGPFALTRHIIGTKGYMAPEYLEDGLITTKLDVYSFGVLMMELLTGQKIEVFQKDLSEILDNMILSEFIDPSLREDYPKDQALFVVKLIRICLNKDPLSRPDMNKVVLNLARILDAVPLKRPDMKRVHPTASSDLIIEDEIAKLRAEMEDERIRHKQELEQERSRYKEEIEKVFSRSKEYLFMMMQRAGISVPNDIDLEVQ
jgi:serine/threonine protein kinase